MAKLATVIGTSLAVPLLAFASQSVHNSSNTSVRVHEESKTSAKGSSASSSSSSRIRVNSSGEGGSVNVNLKCDSDNPSDSYSQSSGGTSVNASCSTNTANSASDQTKVEITGQSNQTGQTGSVKPTAKTDLAPTQSRAEIKLAQADLPQAGSAILTALLGALMLGLGQLWYHSRRRFRLSLFRLNRS